MTDTQLTRILEHSERIAAQSDRAVGMLNRIKLNLISEADANLIGNAIKQVDQSLDQNRKAITILQGLLSVDADENNNDPYEEGAEEPAPEPVAALVSSKTIRPACQGFNSNMASWPRNSTREDKNAAVVASIRDSGYGLGDGIFPGGTIAKHWQKGGHLTRDFSAYPEGKEDMNQFLRFRIGDDSIGPETYVSVVTDAGGDLDNTIICINSSRNAESIENVLEMLQNTEAAGIPIKRVKLGNEEFFNLPFDVWNYETAKDYFEHCRDVYMPRISEVWPDVEFIIVLSTDNEFTEQHWQARGRNWNYAALDTGVITGEYVDENGDELTCRPADYGSIHPYVRTKELKKHYGIAGTEDRTPEFAAEFAKAYYKEQVRLLASPSFELFPDDFKFIVTEANLLEGGGFSGPVYVGGTWTKALCYVMQRLLLTSHERMDAVLMHAISGNVLYGATSGETGQGVDPSLRGQNSRPFIDGVCPPLAVTVCGQINKLVCESLNLGGDLTYLANEPGYIVIQHTHGPTGTDNIFVINVLNESRSVSVPDGYQADFDLYERDAWEEDRCQSITPNVAQSSTAGDVTIPAFSFARLELSAAAS